MLPLLGEHQSSSAAEARVAPPNTISLFTFCRDQDGYDGQKNSCWKLVKSPIHMLIATGLYYIRSDVVDARKRRCGARPLEELPIRGHGVDGGLLLVWLGRAHKYLLQQSIHHPVIMFMYKFVLLQSYWVGWNLVHF